MDERWNWLRGELDILATIYLSRGGWGNGWDEPPEEVLLEIARACFDRGYEAAGISAEHVAAVLTRARCDPGQVERAKDHVYQVMESVYAFLRHENSGPPRLEWVRGVPLHPACDHRSDPRWSTPMRREFNDLRGRRVEVVAYLCVSEREWEERFGDRFERWPGHAAADWLHREDGPALTLYDQAGKVFEEYWLLHGRGHRVGGPQHTMYDRDGSLIEERWMEDDIEIQVVKHKDIIDVMRSRTLD